MIKRKRSGYRHSIDSVRWNWRWSTRYPTDNWTIIGVSQWWFSPTSYRYALCLFGLDLQVWIKREWIEVLP